MEAGCRDWGRRNAEACVFISRGRKQTAVGDMMLLLCVLLLMVLLVLLLLLPHWGRVEAVLLLAVCSQRRTQGVAVKIEGGRHVSALPEREGHAI